MHPKSRAAFTRLDFARLLACHQFYFLLALLVITAGRDVVMMHF